MRILRTTLGSACVSLLLAGQFIAAQNPAPFAYPGGRGFFGRGGGFRARVVTGQPYSGVRTTTFAQTLANGTTINRTITTKEARDSSGRFYRETVMSGGSGGGNGSARTMYTVFDPVNHVLTSWSSDNQQAIVTHLPNFAGHGARHGQWQERAASQSGESPSFHRHGPAPVVEQLGSKTLDGVDVTGTRTTVTFPAGSFGNNQPVTVTRERWVSQDLGITVSETDNDPRSGTRTTTLTNIERTEPDPTLFQVPQGYTTVERRAGHRF